MCEQMVFSEDTEVCLDHKIMCPEGSLYNCHHCKECD